jgi:DNA repair exonuclease SbcCD nuclease subunit
MTLTCVSDWHLGANRSAGTTPATAYQLRQDLLRAGADILNNINGDLLVNGDLFDGPDIPRADLLAAVHMFSDWLARGTGDLFLANGNHDLDKNSTRLSSFQFFAQLLVSLYPERVAHITEGTHLDQHDAYVICHMPNQDLFNLELAKVPACRFLFVHCNYDNQFAVESDHSLNLSKEQAEQLPVEYIVFGHEHQGRTELGGKVVIVGNQFPSSISDCLGHTDKQLLVVRDDGRYEMHTTWEPVGIVTGIDYSEQDWRGLTDTGRFIRVTGTATAAEADKVVTVLGRFRREAKALVITNAVKIEGVADGAEMVLSHEDVTSFNVMEALREYLGPDDAAEVDKIMGEENAGQ